MSVAGWPLKALPRTPPSPPNKHWFVGTNARRWSAASTVEARSRPPGQLLTASSFLLTLIVDRGCSHFRVLTLFAPHQPKESALISPWPRHLSAMRLLNATTLRLETSNPGTEPPYAILSHRWTDDEVLFDDVQNGTAHTKRGFAKLRGCCDVALREGLTHTCGSTPAALTRPAAPSSPKRSTPATVTRIKVAIAQEITQRHVPKNLHIRGV